MTAFTAARLSSWLIVAAAAALVAPGVTPADPTLYPLGEAVVAGCLVGVAVFLVLTGFRCPASLARLPRRRLVARGAVLTAKSAQEEAVWRAFVLGLLVDPLGRLGAITASTVFFAAAHAGRLGRVAAVHLVTGGAFGVTYVATGRLYAAIAAHGTYNVLVGAALLADEEVSETDTGDRSGSLIRSSSPSSRRDRMDEPAPTPSLTAVATLERVVKTFGAVEALAGVDLELRRGEVLALLGPNGAGKSTAVAIMLGLRRPDHGRATLLGLDPRDPNARRTAGAVLQEVGFGPGLRVAETVDLARAHFEAPLSTDDALARLDLTQHARQQAGALSGGQRRRLAVTLALSGNPDVLFLDEPTAGMDAATRRRLLVDLRDFAAEGGAVLLTTQQLAEAEEIATRIVLMAKGRVVLSGSVAEVRARAGKTRVRLRARTLPAIRGAATVDANGDRHVVYVDDADQYVSELVRSGVPFSDLEVVPVSLEDAFVTLTEQAEP